MEDIVSLVFLTLAATLRVATPLVLCAMGGLFSEKSGIIDVGLEGKMLMAAFFAAATASVTGSAWWGVVAAIAAADRPNANPSFTARCALDRAACLSNNSCEFSGGSSIAITRWYQSSVRPR